MKIHVPFLLSLMVAPLLFAGSGERSSQANTTGRTVWNGVYTDAQAARGKAEYQKSCASCHSGNGEDINPSSRLRGVQFMDRWREGKMESLFSVVKSTMPEEKPGSLTDAVYVDIVSFMLQQNGFPAGSKELTLEDVPTIQVEGKDGPKPLPHGAAIQVIGCLTIGADSWMLTKANEPTRTKDTVKAIEGEMNAAKSQPLGHREFRLRNLDAFKGFTPLPYEGQKMFVKGHLIAQPGRERIGVTLIQPLDEDCSRDR